MRYLAASAAMAITASVLAQEPLAIKGFSVGMERGTAVATMPRLECSDPDLCYLSAPTVCRNIEPRHKDAFIQCLQPYLYGGRMPVSWTVHFRQGRLVMATVTIGETTFSEILEALIVRFGPPDKDATSVVQNRYGAQFDQRQVAWSRGGATLRAARRSTSLDESTVTLIDTEYALSRDQERRQSAKERAKGL